MEFVSINDKLPEHNQTVEVKIGFLFIEIQCRFEKTDKGYQFIYIHNDFYHVIYGITHWRPIQTENRDVK